MFTGIVTAIGTIESIEQRGDLRVRIACPFDPAGIAIGASIACSGVCLTVGQPISHVATGQGVPDDIEPASSERIAEIAFGLKRLRLTPSRAA